MNTPIAGQAVSFIMVSDRERALGFYRDVLGMRVVESDRFGEFLDAGGGARVRMTPVPDYKAGRHPVFGWHLEDIVAGLQELKRRGVTFTTYEGIEQDADGIWTAPGGRVRVAWFADPDGNVLSLSQA